MSRYRETNRSLWDGWAEINYRAASYRTEEFRRGANTLHSIELAEVGDVRGQTLLHLQCHFGLDTLSWARMGASVTGVDFSPRGIELAQLLAEELNIPSQFICCDVYDLADHLESEFDIVYTSYGVLCWLPDLTNWARMIARYLKPAGRFHIVEFHPILSAFEPSRSGNLLLPILPYFHTQEPLLWRESGSYADRNADFSHDSYIWPHSLSDIVNALIASGLQIEHLKEFPYCVDNFLPGFMHESPDGWWRLNDNGDSLPLTFSLKAVKHQ